MKSVIGALSTKQGLQWIFTSLCLVLVCIVSLKISGILNSISVAEPRSQRFIADQNKFEKTTANGVNKLKQKLMSISRAGPQRFTAVNNNPDDKTAKTAGVNELKPRLIVFPVFPLLTDPSQDLSRYKPRPTLDQLEDRMLDFMESLQHTLNHPYVARVNLMYTQDAMPDYVSKRVGTHPKLTFDKVESTYDVIKILEHIHTKFKNELVLLTNGDIYPDKGLELVDYDLMKRKKLFYGLSRHGRQESRCKMEGESCDPGSDIYHAEDAYIFIPNEPVPEKAKEEVKGLMWDFYAQDYLLLHIYQDLLKYKVLNPCNVIFMYHNHCSKLRHQIRPRYGKPQFHVKPVHTSDLQR